MSFPQSAPYLLCSGLLALLMQASSLASAGPNEYARILIHLASPVSKNACALKSTPLRCYEIDTSGELETEYFAYVILNQVSPTSGVGAVRFGIMYDSASGSGVDVSSWNACNASLEFPTEGWPAAGTGNTSTWVYPECLPEMADFTMFVAGYFQLTAHTPDEFSLTPHPQYNQAVIADCSGTQDVLKNLVDQLGWAVFTADGTAQGSNPCGFSSGSCHMSGPDSLDIGQSAQYLMKAEEVSPTGVWTVYENVAEITSSNDSSATVHAIAPGLFSIVYQRSDCTEGCGCGKRVQVLTQVPVRPTTWGRIKAGLLRH